MSDAEDHIRALRRLVMAMRLTALRRKVRGEIVARSDAAYESRRRGTSWNTLLPGRRPELIVSAANEDDIVETVRFAREHALRVAVRGGGHSWFSAALREGGILLDLSRLDQITVHPGAGRARVQPVVRNRTLSRILSGHGMAFPYGHCSTVALSGYLLSGGLGWNGGTLGPACFNVDAIDVVTADGKRCTASETENPELFWAARGAGPGFFGIAAGYHLRLSPEPRATTSSTYVFPLPLAGEIAAWLSVLSTSLPRTTEIHLALTRAPADVANRCADSGGMACRIMATAFVDTREEAVAQLEPLEGCPAMPACLAKSLYQTTPFGALFDGMDALFPERRRYLADNFWTNTPIANVLAGLRAHAAAAPSKDSLLLCPILPPPPGGAPPFPDAAFSMTAPAIVLCYAIWEKDEDDEANRAWHRRTVELLDPLAAGHYLGECDLAVSPARAARCFAPANWARLQSLREKYDPDHMFYGLADADC